MEVKTINPILVDPTDANVNGYLNNSVVNIDLKGQAQDVNVGDFVVKGTNPVFVGDTEASRNEFLFAEPVELDGETLTPNDEFLYSNVTGKEQRRIEREMRRKAREKANQTTPGNGEPPASEQDAKAKEGKFWNVLKGGWESFSKSSSGQIILDSATNYISNKLGGTAYSQPGGEAPVEPKKEDEATPMSATTKYVLIGAGVLLLGIVVYSLTKKK